MRFSHYIEEKRFFLLLYVVLTGFITLMMIVSAEGAYAVSNIIYINVGCLFLAATYIIGGYFYHQSFYRELKELIEREGEDGGAAMPASHNGEQQLYMQLFKILHVRHEEELEQLRRERREYQDFIMSWVHEVKLPITASRLLMNNSAGKTSVYLVDKLEDELNKIDNYVEQALYYSRVGSFANDYFITEVSLSQTIKESIKKYSKLFINKHIHVTMWEVQQCVYSDSKWLGFVIDQIVANALKYTQDGGTISFVFEEDTTQKQLHIRDTGIGIKPEDISRVFEKGFTGASGRQYAKSTGMGLYLARHMAVKLGHRISLQSEEGQYTQVTIHFPKITNYQRL